jgi:hypothetical protein
MSNRIAQAKMAKFSERLESLRSGEDLVGLYELGTQLHRAMSGNSSRGSMDGFRRILDDVNETIDRSRLLLETKFEEFKAEQDRIMAQERPPLSREVKDQGMWVQLVSNHLFLDMLYKKAREHYESVDISRSIPYASLHEKFKTYLRGVCQKLDAIFERFHLLFLTLCQHDAPDRFKLPFDQLVQVDVHKLLSWKGHSIYACQRIGDFIHFKESEDKLCCVCLEVIRSTRSKCGGCRLIRYCSKACQKEDWANHRHDCRLIFQARNGD